MTSGEDEYTGEVVIPSTVTYKNRILSVISIGRNAFGYCTGLASVTIPNSITSLNDNFFEGCWNLNNLVIEDGENSLSLDSSTFSDNPLETLYIGRNLSYYISSVQDSSPFAHKSKIKSITIGNSVTSIDEGAFFQCYGLTNITFGNSVTSIGNNAFYGCSGLTNITIPNSVTSIGEFAFSFCDGLTNIAFGNSVTSIGNSAFQTCSGLTNITLPNSVTSIGGSAFSSCSGLTSIIIGNSVTSIGKYAFNGCSGLTNITSLNPTPPTIEENTFTNAQYLNTTLNVPYEALSAYQAANIWKNFWEIQGTDVSGIQSVEKTRQGPTLLYDINGRNIIETKKGINIIKMNDGNVKKVLVK